MQSHTHKWNINQFTAQKYKGWQTGFLENSTWFWLFNYWWAELRLLNDTPLAVGERKDARLEEKRGGEKRVGIKRSVEEGDRNSVVRELPAPLGYWSVDLRQRLRALYPAACFYTTKIRTLIKTQRDRDMLMDCSNLTCLNGDGEKESKASQGWQML